MVRRFLAIIDERIEATVSDDLRLLVRAIYASNIRSQWGKTEAFEHAVEMLMRRRPLLSPEEARQETAAILGVEEPVS